MRVVSVVVLVTLASSGAHAQWSAPVLDPNINTASSEFDPSPNLLGTTLYFASNQPGHFEIFRATRTAPYAAFGSPTQIVELGTTGTEAGPCVRGDELEIFFYSNRAGGAGGSDIWRAIRTSTSMPWSAPTPVSELNTTLADFAPSVTADGLILVFARTTRLRDDKAALHQSHRIELVRAGGAVREHEHEILA
jgi:hypothetical protein